MTWRERSGPIIARVIAEHGDNERELQKALYRAYPWGPRKYHPYKIWLSEIQRQMAKRKLPTATITGSLFESDREEGPQ